MKKRINITFFGICFLAALLGEVYCIEILKGDLFSTIGIGIVVLITGYLFIDSIISTIRQNMEDIKFYTDRMIREEDEKWNERYTELVNLQKATYTATKKNTAILTQQIKEAMSLLEGVGSNNTKELQRIIELQKISMEGQKNALNMEIHYNRANTKKLISVLRENAEKADLSGDLSKIISLLESNNELLKNRIYSIGDSGETEVPGMSAAASEITDNEISGEIPEEENEIPVMEEEAPAEVNEVSVKEEEASAEEDEVSVKEEGTPIEENEASVKEEETLVEENEVPVMKEETPGKENITRSEDTAIEADNKISDPTENNASETHETYKEETEPEAVEIPNENEKITPLYDDPNKALSADEIAALFASFGK